MKKAELAAAVAAAHHTSSPPEASPIEDSLADKVSAMEKRASSLAEQLHYKVCTIGTHASTASRLSLRFQCCLMTVVSHGSASTKQHSKTRVYHIVGGATDPWHPSLALPACRSGCSLATMYCLLFTPTHYAQKSSIGAKATAKLWVASQPECCQRNHSKIQQHYRHN